VEKRRQAAQSETLLLILLLKKSSKFMCGNQHILSCVATKPAPPLNTSRVLMSAVIAFCPLRLMLPTSPLVLLRLRQLRVMKNTQMQPGSPSIGTYGGSRSFIGTFETKHHMVKLSSHPQALRKSRMCPALTRWSSGIHNRLRFSAWLYRTCHRRHSGPPPARLHRHDPYRPT
jgi:hypothetical protein